MGGRPKYIFSDNDLNEICWGCGTIAYFGGVWERHARSAKKALRITLNGQLVNDESLVTFKVETKSLLDTRLLTHVTVERTTRPMESRQSCRNITERRWSDPYSWDSDEARTYKRWVRRQALTHAAYTHALCSDLWRQSYTGVSMLPNEIETLFFLADLRIRTIDPLTKLASRARLRIITR